MYDNLSQSKGMLIHLGKLRVSTIAESIELGEKLNYLLATILVSSVSKQYWAMDILPIFVNHKHYIDVVDTGCRVDGLYIDLEKEIDAREYLREISVIVNIFNKYIKSINLDYLTLGVNFRVDVLTNKVIRIGYMEI